MKEYKGWLVSPNLIKRSVAVFGHYMLGYIIIALGVGIPVTILLVILWY